MRQTFKVTRLTTTTARVVQDQLREALEAIPGVRNVELSPATHEFSIETDGAQRAAIIKASNRAGFHVQNNVAD